jgi:hypothetical protein
MASVPPQGPVSPFSERLAPADRTTFRNELTACLALVAPVGMTEEARRDWLAVAWGTLKHLPSDLLTFGCQKARETCDHPAKIVPAIVEATRESMKFRKNVGQEAIPEARRIEPKYVTPEEATAILKEFGLKK